MSCHCDMCSVRRYLIWFAQEHVSFKVPEMDSLLSMLNIKARIIEKPTSESFYAIIEVDSESCLTKLASRSVSIRWCIELWSRAKNYERLHENIKSSLTNNQVVDGECEYSCDKKLMDKHFNNSFKVNVETFNRHFTLAEKVKKIETFDYLPMEGPVDLKNPETELMLIELYAIDASRSNVRLDDIFFGRLIAEGNRSLISKLSLKTRKFIGNTSMDPQLSVFTVNQAQISDGDFVLDPFVGTGSLLVAAAEFGGNVWGSDIDFLMLHGRTKPTRVNQKKRDVDENIINNMKQYKTDNRYMDVVVSDFSLPLWRSTAKFDAIITDPPYGIREPMERIGIERENYTLTPEQIATHIPSKIDYGLTDIFHDLLNFAAAHLEFGRFLVCWFPCPKDAEDFELPSHKCLQLVANSEQSLSRYASRRLLTYKKISEPDDETNGSEEYVLKNPMSFNFREKFLPNNKLSRRQKRELKQKLYEETNKT